MSGPKVLISGSGIAGSVFAFWLLRAYRNANITIVERTPTLRLTGASVDIRSNAVDIIKWMGAEQEIRKHSTNEQGIQFVYKNGKPFATLAATGRTDAQSITSEFEIFRGALAKIFMDPVRENVKLIFDESVDKYEPHEDGVDVTFATSKKTERYDLLVAADGFGSRIRGRMLKTNPHEQIYDEGVHAAYFSINKDLLNGSRLAKWYNAPGGRCIFLRPDPDPAGKTRGHFMNITTKGQVDMKKRLNDAISEGNESYMKLLEESFKDAGWLAPEVLKGMRESDDFYCSLFGQIRSPKLQDGRVVLLGDAGYATPGFGTSLAIIGAYVLAGEMMRDPGDIGTALEKYEGLMLPFVKGSQGGDNAMQILNPQTTWGISIRNNLLWLVTWSRLDKLAIAGASMFGFGETKAPLPDYEWPALPQDLSIESK